MEIDGFCCDHIFGNKSLNTKKGRYSGGLSVYYKNSLKNNLTIIDKNQCGIMWVKLSHELFVYDEDVYICNMYILPTQSKVLKQDEIDFFELLEIGIEKYCNLGKIYAIGDFNSRTSNCSDILDFDKYLEDDELLINHNSVNTTTRVNRDHVLDSNGARLLHLCQTTGLVIANGRLLSDSQLGEFTFCSHAGRTSVVDYLLLNYSDFDSISEFKILNFNEFSDHAPILFSIKTKTCAFQNSNDNHNTHAQSNITWEESKVTEFRHMLLNNIEPLHSVLDDVFNSTTNIDDVVTSFTSHLYERAHSIFGKQPHKF